MDDFINLVLGIEKTKGGGGSGNIGHAGRPGKVGESSPQGKSPDKTNGNENTIEDAKANYDANAWRSMSIEDRKAAWEKETQARRDAMANAKESIKKYQDEILADLGERPSTGYLEKDVAERLNQARDLIALESSALIDTTAIEMSGVLEVAGVDKGLADKMVMDAVDSLIAQEYESVGRQLGDHGIHHIKGDIDVALEIAKNVPGADTPEDIASLYVTGIYHDAGYLTDASRDFLDEGHNRWSAEHYDTHVKEMATEALGERTANNITHMIRTHQATDIDWSGDTVASAFRVSDNVALFQEEKLPPLFRYVPEAMDIMEQFAGGKLSNAAMQSKMKAAVRGAEFSDKMKKNMLRAVMEITPFTPKATLGMLGGNLDSIEWAKDHIKINLRRNKEADRLTKLLDLGQKQFAKFAKTYGKDPKDFLKDLNFQFNDKSGGILLEGRIVGEKEFQEALEKRLTMGLTALRISKDLKKNLT